MTNQDFSSKLRRLADAWEKMEEPIDPPFVMGFPSKDQLKTLVRTIGGRWTKRVTNPDDPKWSNMQFTSTDTGLLLQIPRSAFCKIVAPAVPAQYECEPLLSPDEEALAKSEAE